MEQIHGQVGKECGNEGDKKLKLEEGQGGMGQDIVKGTKKVSIMSQINKRGIQ